MKKILLLLTISLFLITGCINQTICNPPYINFEQGCCLDNNKNNICDSDENLIPETQEEIPEEETVPVEQPEEETVPVEQPEEETVPVEQPEEETVPVEQPQNKFSSYYLKLGDSVDFKGNQIKLSAMDQTMGQMEVILEINGEATAFYSTNTEDIFKNLNVSITKTDYQKMEAIVAIEEPTLGDNEIVLIKDQDVTFAGYIITLNDVQKYDENIIVSVNGLQQRANIVEGNSKIFGNIEITNVDGKYRKENYQRYAIVKFREL